MELFRAVRSKRSIGADGFPFRLGDTVRVIAHFLREQTSVHDAFRTADSPFIKGECCCFSDRCQFIVVLEVLHGIKNTALPKDAARCGVSQFEIVAAGRSKHSSRVEHIVQSPALFTKCLNEAISEASKNTECLIPGAGLRKRKRVFENP